MSPLVRPETRALATQEQRDRWESLVGQAPHLADIATILQTHPRRALLTLGFNGGSYIARYGDLAHLVDAPLHTLVHYLEFGCEEGRNPNPTTLDRAFVEQLYGREAALLPPSELVEHLTTVDGVPFRRHVFLNADELCAAYELRGGRLPRLFDPAFYRSTYLTPRCATYNAAQCLEHFARVGQHVGCAPSESWRIDEVFYQLQYGIETSTASEASVIALDPCLKPRVHSDRNAALTRSFLRQGLHLGHHPNLRIFVLKVYGIAISSEIEARLLALSAESAPYAKPSDLAGRLLEEPLSILPALKLRDPLSASVLWTIADRLRSHRREGERKRLGSKIAELFPDLPSSANFRGKRLARANLLGEAAEAFRAAVAGGVPDPTARLRWAECLLSTGDMTGGIDVLAEARRAPNQNLAAARHAEEKLRAAVDGVWSSRNALVAVNGPAAAQDIISHTARAYTSGHGVVRQHGAVRSVAIVGDHTIPQCRLYRIKQKAEQLQTAGYKVRVFDGHAEAAPFQRSVPEFEAVIFYRVPALTYIMDAMLTAGNFGLATFYEVDDLIFDRAHFPLPFETYAERITPAQYADMACGVPLFQAAMNLCDYGIASTPTLQRLMEPHVRTGRVFLHRNALGREHLQAMEAHHSRTAFKEVDEEPQKARWSSRSLRAAPKPPRPQSAESVKADEPCTIVYGSGTKAHKRDFQHLLEPALIEIAERFGSTVRIVIIGDMVLSEALAAHPSVQSIRQLLDFPAYLDVIAQSDISLAVLEPSLAADTKSEIKWLEAAMFGVPSVVSATATHREVIRHGENGFLCSSSAEFARAIALLVANPELRRRVGDAASADAVRHYGLERMGANLRAMIESVEAERPRHRRRILVVNVFYPPASIGGATRVVVNNVDDLRAAYGDEFEIDVASTWEDGGPAYEVVCTVQDGVRVFGIRTPPADWMVPDNPNMAEPFARILDWVRPDLVHFHCIQVLTSRVVDVTALRRIPYVITAHDGWWISPHQFLTDENDTVVLYDYERPDPGVRDRQTADSRALALRNALFGAQRVLAVSEPFRQIYAAAGVPRVVTVENGVERIAVSPRTASPDGRVRLAHIGGTARHKGLPLIRDALRSRPFRSFHMTVVDSTLPRGTVEEETWGTTPVTRRAPVHQDDVAALYASIDILLAPSIWPESFGLVTREALQAGCWVIASDRGAVGADVAEDANGHIIDVSTYVPLADLLERIDAAPDRYRQAPSVPPALRTSADQAQDLAQLYRELL